MESLNRNKFLNIWLQRGEIYVNNTQIAKLHFDNTLQNKSLSLKKEIYSFKNSVITIFLILNILKNIILQYYIFEICVTVLFNEPT